MSKHYQPTQPTSSPLNYMYKPFLDLVVDPENWKNPIDVVVDVPKDKSERKLFVDLITNAVIFFCGCVPEILTLEDYKVRVRAAGYYMSVGS